MSNDSYEAGLEKGTANYVALSPVSLVRRAVRAYPDASCIVYKDQIQTWADTYERCVALAGALQSMQIGPNSTVAVLAQNIPSAVELSYAVPLSGGVLNMINTRLDPASVAFIIDHGEAEVFFIDAALAALGRAALKAAKRSPKVVLIEDDDFALRLESGETSYEAMIAGAESREDLHTWLPTDEWNAIALNYTSGTTGNPKGVVYHHRGAYLNAIGNALEWCLPVHFRYLWALPLFHCNGWCFPWTIAAKAGVNICLRSPEASQITAALAYQDVTHMCGAPIILSLLVEALEAENLQFETPLAFMTAGAAPPASIIKRAEARNIDVTHVYGLTEVYGPTAICAWRSEWDQLSQEERAEKRARQGVNYAIQEELSVRDPETLARTPADGEALGEIMFRGNAVMKGYLKDPNATRSAMHGGYFRSGDIGVQHPDGHIELRDRSKDIIISGGENISSIEVENAIYKHEAVSLVAVVAGPHSKWGETPVAFVELASGRSASEKAIIDHCRDLLAHFKCPTKVIFGVLPKTSTGKIQKFVLRERL